jgi:hypothetical protein
LKTDGVKFILSLEDEQIDIAKYAIEDGEYYRLR